ncbi:MAG: helix-turn-helix transcriptional regulator [Clostridia bacterium]|nr:helix-turn-helix transcriptional regulator [Clostridia bacterium]
MQQYYELVRDENPRTVAWYADNNHFLTHFHSTIELAYVESGVICAIQDGVSHQVPAGHLIVNSSYMVHGYSSPEPSRIIVCTIPLSTLPKLRGVLSQHSFEKSIVDAHGMKECRRLLRMMADASNRNNFSFVNSLGEALIAFLIDKIGLRENPSDAENDLIKRILRYLQEHASEPVTVAQAASYFGYSTGRFSHIFNERIGCSFTRYVNSLRVDMARQMLAQGGMTLLETATACGFSSIRTFHRVYKDFTGETPRSMQTH